MRTFFLILLVSPCFAAGPKYSHNDRLVNDEFVQVYHDIKSVLLGDVRISSITISTAAITFLQGTLTNDSAAQGGVGEYVSNTYSKSATTTDTWEDATSISLTAGDWDISYITYCTRGATSTMESIRNGVSTTSGNSATGLTEGDNMAYFDINADVDTMTITIPSHRRSIASATTYYAKLNVVWAGANAPTCKGRISARRVR